jgi:hypothetical protein
MNVETFPPLPLKEWQDTKVTLHLFTQIVGKIRLALTPRLNHWWHVPLYVSSRGLTTSAVPYGAVSFEMEFDFVDHDLAIRTSRGETRKIPLMNNTVAEFHGKVFSNLRDLEIEVDILDKPFDSSRVKSEIPFTSDTTHATYDPEYARRFWSILVPIDSIMKEFRGRFLGKCSPVHFFWHSFDLAVTRFSGKRATVAPDADPVTREAYSHEVISAGFWPGDDNLPEPAFYCYVHPEPKGLPEQPLRPASASWNPQNGTHMAILLYEDLRKSADPSQALLDFLQSTYEAGAKLAGWSREELEL